MEERGWARWALGAIGAWPIALGGCVAQIQETRLDGVPRPTLDAHSEVVTERRAAVDGTVQCRDVVVTAPMVREVEIRRSFADNAQERNGALAMLLGAGMGALAFGQDQVQCPQQGGPCSAPKAAASVLLGLAAIPLGFLVYNAVAVQDGRVVEPVAPEARPGAWRACSE